MDKKERMQISVRLTQEQSTALQSAIDQAKAETKGYAPLSDVLKELAGLSPWNLLNEEYRKRLSERFQGKARSHSKHNHANRVQ